LAWLIEGDGSIIVPKTIRIQKGKLLGRFYCITKKASNYVVIFTFVFKDAPANAALKLLKIIRGGTIVYPKDSNYLELLFQDIKSIQKIACSLKTLPKARLGNYLMGV
jgi:hypothetical protein